MNPADGQQAFLVVAAQIIPILIVALLADPLARQERSEGHTAESTYILLALVAGVIGEGIALAAIGSGATGWRDNLVGLCMMIIAFVILRPHVRQHYTALLGHLPPNVRHALDTLITGVLLCLVYLPQFWMQLNSSYAWLVWAGVLLTLSLVGWQAWRIYTGRQPLPNEDLLGRRPPTAAEKD